MKQNRPINQKGIVVYNAADPWHRKFSSRCEIFANSVYFEKNDKSITFYKATKRTSGRIILKSYVQKCGSYRLAAYRLGLEPGFYPLDVEASNERKTVFTING